MIRETSTTEILGWRKWMNRVSVDQLDDGSFEIHLDLMSLFFPVVWDGPSMVADQLPTADNKHGVYASKTGDGLEEEGHIFYGTVGLSGLVLEHEDGYRAQTGVIRELWFNQTALCSIVKQMLLTPGLTDNLPGWDLALRFVGDSAAVQTYLEKKYHCEVKMVAPYSAIALESDIATLKALPPVE